MSTNALSDFGDDAMQMPHHATRAAAAHLYRRGATGARCWFLNPAGVTCIAHASLRHQNEVSYLDPYC